MSRNRMFLIIVIVVALIAPLAIGAISNIPGKSSGTDQSDYALRHPEVLNTGGNGGDLSDYALRHPEVVRAQAGLAVQDLSDYAQRHPELLNGGGTASATGVPEFGSLPVRRSTGGDVILPNYPPQHRVGPGR